MDIFTSDPEYQATPLISPIPPPSLTEEEIRRFKNKHDFNRNRNASSLNHHEQRKSRFQDRNVPREPNTDKVPYKRKCLSHIPSEASSNQKAERPQQDPALSSPDTLEWYFTQNPSESIPSKKENEENKVADSGKEITSYFDLDLAQKIVKAKKELGNYSRTQLYQARHASSPYECLETNIFLNRAALKLAEIDAFVDFSSLLKPQNARFVDLCCGPGGFTEYLLWRYPQSQGYGISLATGDHMAFSPNLFLHTTRVQDRFQCVEGDLILEPEKLTNLAKEAILVVADGGMAVDGMEEEQEAKHVPLIQAEIQTALKVLSPQGSFVLKLYDVTSSSMLQLLAQLSQVFEKCALYKPRTSRPANSERYFIGIRFLKDSAGPTPSSSPQPPTSSFLKYMAHTNRRHQQRQLLALNTFLKHLRSPHLPPLELPQHLLHEFLERLKLPKDPPKRSRKTV